MDRRSALAFIGLGMLGGCGGGGGGAGSTGVQADGLQDPASASSASASTSGAAQGATGPSATAVRALSPNIAAWGDSITDLYASHLQAMEPGRQVFNGGVVGQPSMQIASRVLADADHKTWISIFWYGHNNYTKDQVKADIAASVASLAPGNQAFIVLSMLTWAGSGDKGTQEYQDTMRVNSELAAQYPDNYLDIHSYLVGLYDPSNAQDVADHANDLTPSSLRFDAIHLNDAGCDAVASRIKAFIASKNW